jgi:hypothetical protein
MREVGSWKSEEKMEVGTKSQEPRNKKRENSEG